MSANPNAAPVAPAPAKSKKLIVIAAIIAVLAIVAAGAYVWMMQRQHTAEGEEGAAASAPATAPVFLPMDNMVANLADPGGDRFVQLGITLELADEKTSALVKQYLPSIRNGILMQVSQHSADELLAREGKEKLAAEILAEVSAPLGFGTKVKKQQRARDEDEEDADEEAPRRNNRKNPVRRVLFSSFIIQ